MASEDRYKKFLFHALSHIENAKIEHNPDVAYTASLSNGNSSPSFGRMQNDVANNDDAKTTFTQIINNSVDKVEGLAQKNADRIIELSSIPGLQRTTKETQELRGYIPIINQCLSSSEDIDKNHPGVSNRTLVDRADAANFEKDYTSVQRAIAAAATNPNGSGQLNKEAPNPELLTRLVSWRNQHGNLQGASEFLGNAKNINNTTFDAYLQEQKYFEKHPNFVHEWPGRVTAATNYALQQVGARTTTLTANKDGELKVTPFEVNNFGQNYMATYQNAQGKRSATLWAFASATAPTTNNLNLQIDGAPITGVEGGKWLSLNLPQNGHNTYTPSNNIALVALQNNSLDKKHSFLGAENDTHLSLVASQLRASGFALPDQEPIVKFAAKTILEKLKIEVEESGLTAGGAPPPNNHKSLDKAAAKANHI